MVAVHGANRSNCELVHLWLVLGRFIIYWTVTRKRTGMLYHTQWIEP